MTINGIVQLNLAKLEPYVQTFPPQRASQFEAMFLQSLFKSNCLKEHFIAETEADNIKGEAYVQTFLGRQYIAINKSLDLRKEEFFTSLWPFARRAGNVLGLNPKILLAQAALETSFGKYISRDSKGRSSNNLFNIKATRVDKDTIDIMTTEYFDHSSVKVKAYFKKYSSISKSFDDYVSLINRNPRYEAARANASNPERYIQELQHAGYATDPHYASKILAIFHCL